MNAVFQNHRVQGLGMVLVWIGFLLVIGLVSVLATANSMARGPRGAATDEPPLPRIAMILGSLGSIGVVASLALPWISGPGADGGRLRLSGFSGLDPLSLLAILFSMLVGFLGAARPGPRGRRPTVLFTAGASSALLIGGNLLIQAAHPDGSRVDRGFTVGLACTAALLLGGALGLRPKASP